MSIILVQSTKGGPNGGDDHFISLRLAGRLQRDFPDARLELVDRSRAFVPEDRPERLAELISGFV